MSKDTFADLYLTMCDMVSGTASRCFRERKITKRHCDCDACLLGS